MGRRRGEGLNPDLIKEKQDQRHARLVPKKIISAHLSRNMSHGFFDR
jgi:hypothetical protein